MPPPLNNSDYLQADLQTWLNMGEAQFNFMAQFRNDPDKMPLDKATVPWSETDSTPARLATLVIRQHAITVLGQDKYGENLSFNPWPYLERA